MVHSLASTGSASRVYYVNGPVSTSGPISSAAAASNSTKRRRKKDKPDVMNAGTGVRLIQDLEFPEASYRIKATRDGRYLMATGTYKPRMKVWDLAELSLKFERVTDSENVDFIILSDDWTKTVHLQADRSIEFHNQTHAYYCTRIPKFGRAINYHYPTCDILAGGDGGEVYRLNLEQGRFLNPFKLEGHHEEGSSSLDTVTGVNCIDINPAHQLFGFGTETELGKGTAEFWDPRSRERAGILRLPYNSLETPSQAVVKILEDSHATLKSSISVTALASRDDGLNIAVGTSSGHTLLYDLRHPKPYTIKDQGYGLPIKVIRWPHTPSSENPEGLVATADSKVVKVWNRDNSENVLSVNPPSMVNDLMFYPSTGLMIMANEDTPITSLYVPDLGPAPRWAKFLDSMTEEMEEDQAGATIYEDYKFIDKTELYKLGLDHLVGTPTLKPYMHGYFVNLQLYSKARAIANPFAYSEYREKKIAERMAKEQESRIRSSANKTKKNVKVSVNERLAERILEKEEKERRRQEKKAKEVGTENSQSASSLLSDPRFKDIFTNPEFRVDESSREYALVNPSGYSQSLNKKLSRNGESSSEGEDEENDDDDDDDEEEEEEEEDEDGQLFSNEMSLTEESEDEEMYDYEDDDQIVTQVKASKKTKRPVYLVEDDDNHRSSSTRSDSQRNIQKTLGQRIGNSKGKLSRRDGVDIGDDDDVDGEKEFTFIPSSKKYDKKKHGKDRLQEDGGGNNKIATKAAHRREQEKTRQNQFGAGLQKGSTLGDIGAKAFEGDAGQGRTHRRKVTRSASRTALRKQ